MSILGATTVIPDFVRHLTDSEILIGLASNLFIVGFTLPQLVIARFIVRHERKKWWFVGPNIPVRFVLVIFALIAVWLGKDNPGLVLLVFFICYGIAGFGDGLVGVPWTDMVGTSLDNRWRARMFGLTTALTGVIMLLLTPLIALVLGGPEFPNNYAILFGAAGVLLVISIPIGMFFHELPGGKAVEKLPALSEFLPDLGRVLRDDLPFRAYIITRMFTNLFLMAAPFYIGYTTVVLGLSSDVAVPGFLAMQTIGSVAGALIYTWLGARSNSLSIHLALGGSALLPICALLAGVVGPAPLYLGFLVWGMSSANLASAYQTWVVTYAHPDQRPIYIGLSNTLTALVLLIAPFIAGSIVQLLGYEPLFVVAVVMTFAALFVSLRYMNVPRVDQEIAAEAAEAAGGD
jgi:MFS family permease